MGLSLHLLAPMESMVLPGTSNEPICWLFWGAVEVVMVRLAAAMSVLFALVASASAQQLGRSQDGYYSGQSNGQYSGQSTGQANLRVDGRAGKNQGLPPSAADKSNRRFDNPVNANDCTEVDALKPDARPGYQDRVRSACDQY